MTPPGSWIFASIVHIPLFPAYNIKDNVCQLSEEEWIPNFFSYWTAIVISTMVLMIWLYSRILRTLWFKRDPDNQLTFTRTLVVKELISGLDLSYFGH